MADMHASSKKGLKEGEERFMTVTTSSVIEDLKNIAYWDRLLIKDVATQSFTDYIKEWKQKNPSLVVDGRVKAAK